MEKEIEISVAFSLEEKNAIDKKAAELGMSSEELVKKTLLEECRKMDDNTQDAEGFFE